MGLEKLNCLESGMEGLMRELVSELGRSLEYFRLQSNHEELSQIILCGGGARLGGIEEYLSREVGVPVQIGISHPRCSLRIPFPPRKRRSLSMSIR